MKLKLDRNFYSEQTFGGASKNREYWLSKSDKEKLHAAWYLICSAYNLPFHSFRKIDKTVYKERLRNE